MNAAETTNLPAVVPVRLRLTAEGQLERDDYPSQRLTRIEARLLLGIARRRGCMDKGALYTELYGTRADAEMPEPKIVDVMVCKLRHKLEAVGARDAVVTVWGRGYQMNRPGFDVNLVDEDHVAIPMDGTTVERLDRLAIATGRTVPQLTQACLAEGLKALERKAWGSDAA